MSHFRVMGYGGMGYYMSYNVEVNTHLFNSSPPMASISMRQRCDILSTIIKKTGGSTCHRPGHWGVRNSKEEGLDDD